MGERRVEVHTGEQVRREGYVRVVCVSDTHNQLGDITIPPGDIFLHCGDFTLKGTIKEVQSFVKSLNKLPHLQKFVIAGNHDLCLDYGCVGLKPALTTEYVSQARQLLSTACVYLENSGAEAFGYYIYGSPYIPKENKAAFTIPRKSPELATIRSQLPGNAHILMTHCPPRGYHDYSIKHRKPVGDDQLASHIHSTRPVLSVFGHIHEGYGNRVTDWGGVIANVAACNREFQAVNAPLVVDLPVPGPLWQGRI